MSTRPQTAAPRRGRHPAPLLLVAAIAVAGVLLVEWGARLSFLLDDWVFIVYRRGFNLDAFMKPDNEHFVAGPVAVWKLLLALFGMGSTVPYRVVSAAMFLLGVWMAFVWMRRRLGQWPALLGTIPIVFLGAAFDDVLWFASITFLGSMLGGLAMLLALDRRDRNGDRLACAGLVVSLLFSSLWLAFAAGAVIDIFLRRRERPWRSRAYVVGVPVAVFVLWWIGWGHSAESALSLHNLGAVPLYVYDSIAAALAALLGLAVPVAGMTQPAGLDWGRPLAALLILLAIWRMSRMERVPRSAWVMLTIALAFWILGGLDLKPGRSAWASRYQYPSAVFMVLFAAALLRGVRLDPRRLLAPALLVVTAAVLANLVFLHEAYQSYHATSEIERADLGAVVLARKTVDPGLVLGEEIANTNYVAIDAGSYLSAEEAFGSQAYSDADIARASGPARVGADQVLAAALPIALRTVPAPGRRRGCREMELGGKPTVIALQPGGALLRPSAGGTEIALHRYAAGFPVHPGTLPGGSWGNLSIPLDGSTRPWRARLEGRGRITVCRSPDAG